MLIFFILSIAVLELISRRSHDSDLDKAIITRIPDIYTTFREFGHVSLSFPSAAKSDCLVAASCDVKKSKAELPILSASLNHNKAALDQCLNLHPNR